MKLIIQPQQRIRFRNIVFGIGSVLLVTFSLGLSSPPRNNSAASLEGQIRIQINQTLDSIKFAYTSENLPDFINLLDKDYEDRLTFQSNLQSYFISHKNPEIMFITDVVLINKDKTSVRLRWFKKIVDNSGTFSKSQGSSQFVFKQYPEGLKLFYIRQDNPFF